MKTFALAATLMGCLSAAASVVAEEPTAEDYMKFFKYLEGQWKTSGTLKGESFEGTWTAKRSPTGHCLDVCSTISGQPFDHFLHGYDPGAKCWRGCGFQADGAFIQLQARFDPESLPVRFPGAKLKGKAKAVTAAGEVKSVETVTTIISEDKFKHEVSGERPAEVVFERQKKDK